jgi:hypothetical protein
MVMAAMAATSGVAATPAVATTMVVVMMVVAVDAPDGHQRRAAAEISLGPGCVLGAVAILWRIGVAGNGWFGTGRETSQKDDRREESRSTHCQ